MRPTCQAEPDGVNYDTRSPLAKGVRDHFHDHVVGAVHIGVEALTRSRHERSPRDALALVLFLVRQGLAVQEAALAGVGLLSHDHLKAHHLGLIGQHLDEAGMREEDECLIRVLSQGHILLPTVILPDDQGTDTMLDEMINDAAAGHMEIAVHLPFPLVGEHIEAV